jgi:hypothetical protein
MGTHYTQKKPTSTLQKKAKKQKKGQQSQHACDLTRRRMISTRKVQFSPVECDLTRKV